MKRVFPFVILALILASCKPEVLPSQPISIDIRKVYLEYYGAYYSEEGLPHNVFALDCYDQGLLLNQQGRIEGSGQNLYLSDIFVADSLLTLPAGTYTSDSTGAPMTFLPGRLYEGQQVNGAYILDIEENVLVGITLLEQATMHLAYEGDTAVVHIEGVTSTKKKCTADYRGKLYPEDKTDTHRVKAMPWRIALR